MKRCFAAAFFFLGVFQAAAAAESFWCRIPTFDVQDASSGGLVKVTRRLSKEEPGWMRLAVVGDMMLGRRVYRRFRATADHPFAAVAPVLQSADAALGNLECVLTDAPRLEENAMRKIRLAAPRACVEWLSAAGFDVLFLANNHSLDFGPSGLEDTREALEKNGMKAIGWWTGKEKVLSPIVLEKQFVRTV